MSEWVGGEWMSMRHKVTGNLVKRQVLEGLLDVYHAPVFRFVHLYLFSQTQVVEPMMR